MSQSRSRMTGTQPTSKRDVAAATEFLATAPHAPGMVEVNNDEGDCYIVDLEGGACTCKDWQYRSEMLDEDGCKHRRRVEMERGERELPPIPLSRIDPLLLRARDLEVSAHA